MDSQCSNSNFALNASGNPPPASSSSGTYLLDNTTGSSPANVAGAGVSSMGGAPVVDTNSTSVVSATPVQPPDYSVTPQDSPSVGMTHMGAGGPLVEMETNVSTPQNSNGVGGPFINESGYFFTHLSATSASTVLQKLRVRFQMLSLRRQSGNFVFFFKNWGKLSLRLPKCVFKK